MSLEKNEAVQDTFRKERRRLFEFIRKRVPEKEDAEDILQDVFYQFIQNFSPIQPIEQISSWLFSVARNKIIDRYRKKKPESLEKYTSRSNDEEVTYDTTIRMFDKNELPDNVYLRSMVWEQLEEALEELPDEQSEVFIMHEMEGMDFKEIAALTGEPVNTLISRKRYAVLYLRDRLRHLYKDILDN